MDCTYGDEAVVEDEVEEAGDHPLVPGEACLDGVVDDALHVHRHARVAAAAVHALAGVVAARQLRSASPADDAASTSTATAMASRGTPPPPRRCCILLCNPLYAIDL